MRRSVATVCLSGTLEEKLDAAAAAGFDEVEIFEPDLVASPLVPEQVRDRAAALGLRIGLYQPFRDFEGVAPGRLQANLRRAEAKFGVMERLGADLMLVCSNVAPDAIDDDDLAAEQLAALAEVAADHGVRIAYEALAWGTHVHTYGHAWRIVEAVGDDALGTCLDSFHILSRHDDPAGIRAIPGEKILYLQLADAPQLGMDVLQWSRHHRCFPGQGAFALPAFLGHVLATGYDGPLSLEVFNDVFRAADPARTAVDAMRSLLVLEDAAGVTALPPAPPLRGYAFAELAVGADDGALERLLVALGFRHAGQHRSKPVQLWRQGATRILLNRAGDGGEPRVAAVGIESSAPLASAERARGLLAPPLTRAVRPDEADLTAVAAPDGTELFFCRSDGGGDSATAAWLSDFLTAGPPPDGATEITGIDHVALGQPVDALDEAALFYRSVLGLELGRGDELVTPDGLVRTRSATSRDGSVRFALSIPLAGRDAAAPQHVALASADVLGAAEAMRARGVPLVAIPENYYDDLAARTELDPELVARMRAAGVLHDRTPDGGELLHVATELIGPGLCFEIVERRGGYSGYGAPNAAVRAAAQRAAAV